MYFYNVTAQESAAMNQLGVSGDCQLVLSPSFEILCILPSQQVVGVWPLGCLRSFSYGNGLFSFEAGRHAPKGPGEYSFISQHDHLIHDRLTEFIEKAKRPSCSGSVNSVRLSSVIDYRPPAQLPVQNRDSSTDSQDNSDTEEKPKKKGNPYSGPPKTTPPEVQSPVKTTPPPLPGAPPPKVPPKSVIPNPETVSIHSSIHGKEQTVNAVSRFLNSSETSDPTLTDDQSTNHVYSHTIHSKQGIPPMDPSQIYNSLVHDKTPSVKNMARYEMAYPESKKSVPVTGPANVVYDTAFNESDGRRKNPSLAAIPLPQPSLSTNVPLPSTDMPPPRPPPPQPISVTDGGMTANPLYGSQGNLLEDIMSKQVFETPQSVSPPIPPKLKSLSASPESLPATVHPDITSNPVYVSSNIRGDTDQLPMPQPSSTDGQLPSNTKYRSTLLNNGNDALQKENNSGDGNGIPRSYSTVSKHINESSASESFMPGSMDSDPPPIPDRIGSFNED